jgi:septal ring factor EnvC (AmiA/AmiB activator)
MDEWKEPHPRRLPSLEEISSTRTSIVELDNELNDLRVQIEQLESRVAVLQNERENQVSFIAPFRRLPQELLANIAKICIRTGDSPSNLNQVCHSFRMAVNSINHAWSTIHLVPRKQSQRTSHHAQKAR